MRKLGSVPLAHVELVIRYAIYSLLALGIVWAAWQLWTTLRGSAASMNLMSRLSAIAVPDSVPEEDIAALHLFGAELPAASQPAARIDATVVGIAYAADDQASRAILVLNGIQQSYAVGATLPGGARVANIEQTRVVLDQAGERYSLILEQKLADRNADFGSLLLPAAKVEGTSPETQAPATTMATRVSDKGTGLQARRQNLTAPPDAPASARGQAARGRVMHRGRVSGRPD